MTKCRCLKIDFLEGDEAYLYSKEHLKMLTHHGSWVRLWKCPDKDIYWEASWQGGGGFDYGKETLRKISATELQENWPEIFK